MRKVRLEREPLAADNFCWKAEQLQMFVNTAHIFKDVSNFFFYYYFYYYYYYYHHHHHHHYFITSLFPDHFLMVAKNTGGFATLLQDIITSSLCHLDSFSCYYKLASCNIYLCHAVVTFNILSELDHRLLYIVCFF